LPRPRPRILLLALLLGVAPLSRGATEKLPDPAAALDRAVAAAESSLAEGEWLSAESRSREVLLEGWLLMGGLQTTAGRLREAREAFLRAANASVETRRPSLGLAITHLQMGESDKAVALMTRVVARNPRDVASRNLLAQAMSENGQVEQAVQELEEARLIAPEDLELAYSLAGGYLKLKKVEPAERLFELIKKQRPIPQTYVLLGRAYRDAGQYARARVELLAALKLDPKARRAHYYLGTLGVMEEGPARLGEAITEFREELKVNPQDPLTNLRLGIALMESRRPNEAEPALEIASHAEPPLTDAFHYLGRAQLALDRPEEAVASLRRAVSLIKGPPFDEVQRGSIHYNLALALRKAGDGEQAAVHFAEAEQASARVAESARERLARYMADAPDPHSKASPAAAEFAPLAELSPAQRGELVEKVTASLCRAYLNLGVMHAQAQRFARAAELFEGAAEVDPAFPQVQYSLGVAYFNAQQFAKAQAPLARALEQGPEDPALRRMLAMAFFNAESYVKAAELLAGDPQRSTDPSLQYAYGLALVRSGRAPEAQAIFSRLLARHGNAPELLVVLGQAHAQQGDYESAVRTLQQALAGKADVAEANATLGVIYLKQGRLPEAEQALRAELEGHPADFQSQQNLAIVLDLLGRPEEALPLLRAALKGKPDLSDARYLLGKILLAQGRPAEALDHLETAARLSPEDPSVQYQLGQAYQKLGRPELAERHFEAFRQLKDKQRGSPS
jgi:tetratricopeptide (TPR) repeat protein